MPGAARAYFSVPPERTRRLLAPDASIALGSWLAAQGHAAAALAVFRRHLRDYPLDSTTASAHLGAGLVQLELLDQAAPAYQHFLDALDADPDDETAGRARQAIGRIAALQKYRLGSRNL